MKAATRAALTALTLIIGCGGSGSGVHSSRDAATSKDAATTAIVGHSCSAPGGACSFDYCTSPDGLEQCGYRASDGTIFACNSCSDCTIATLAAEAWCDHLDTTASTTSDAACESLDQADCVACCGTNHAGDQGKFRAAQQTCACGSCAASCKSSSDYCHGGTLEVGNTGCDLCVYNQLNALCSDPYNLPGRYSAEYLQCIVACSRQPT